MTETSQIDMVFVMEYPASQPGRIQLKGTLRQI